MNFPFVDAHADTIERLYSEKLDFGGDSSLHLDLPRLFGYRAQVFSIWTSPEWTRERALFHSLQMISLFSRVRREKKIRLLLEKKDLDDPSFGAILSLEGASPLVDDPELMEVFFELGVRMVSLTWNERNPFADGLDAALIPEGLTDKGRELVKKMRELGVVLDLSHIAEPGFWDAVGLHPGPLAVSHANAHALCPHPRNLKDEQLEAIAASGGVVGICFAPRFLATGGGDIDDVVRHVDYLREKIGVSCIGLGSDFDGITSTPPGLPDPSGLPLLFDKLSQRGYSEAELRAIAGENWIRLFREVWKAQGISKS
ncbi:MAG TPA: dipeptidase [Cyanobacteria bacterium UBA8530]|nr:dipeptidase [Cyanobacteria bacterium UBA8530]